MKLAGAPNESDSFYDNDISGIAFAADRSCGSLPPMVLSSAPLRILANHTLHFTYRPARHLFSTGAGPVTTAYQNQVGSGDFRHDAGQIALAAKLDALHASLADTDPYVIPSVHLRASDRPLLRPWGPNNDPAAFVRGLRATLSTLLRPTPPPRGVYVHGTVGTGKSHLMDLFYESLLLPPPSSARPPGSAPAPAAALNRRRRRAHFHEFMLDVHGRIHEHKKACPRSDPVPPVALSLAREARVLCFDEFQVTDIADAMIVKRLFTMLFELKVVVVATSNRAPEELYEGGINRSLFVPFIDTVRRECDVFEMGGGRDYRMERAAASGAGLFPSYLCPPGDPDTRAVLEEIFASGGGEARTETVDVMMGRSVTTSRSNDSCAWFNFRELCCRPLGAADYIALCDRFPLLVVDYLPQLGADRLNEARRFVTLVDAMYESRTRLVIAADVPIGELFVGFDATLETRDGDEEVAVQGLSSLPKAGYILKEKAIGNQRGDEESWLSGEGGSSSSSSTTMIRTRDGNVEWSATGRIGVSLSQLSAVKDVAFSFKRAQSRLVEMSGEFWGR